MRAVLRTALNELRTRTQLIKPLVVHPLGAFFFLPKAAPPQTKRGRRGIPPLEPFLPRRPSEESALSLRLRDSAERLNKIFFFLN
jgi:hypothetical protein